MLVVADLVLEDVDDARAEALAREERVPNDDDWATAFAPSAWIGSSTLVGRI